MKHKLLNLFGEGLLIIFSVLLAFWIDRKSQQWRDEGLKTTLFERIRSDLQNDSLHFTEFLARHDYVERQLETLILYSSSAKITQDSLVQLIRSVEWVFTFTPNHATYQSIVSAGQLSLFERDTIFREINQYYSVNQKKLVAFSELYGIGINRFLDDYLNNHFDRRLLHNQYNHLALPIDLEKFTSREFVNVLLSMQDFLIQRDEFLFHFKKLNVLLSQMKHLESQP